MKSTIRSIALDKLVAHPDSPNRMSSSTFAKLVRNIEHTGLYEPLIVRPLRRRRGRFQIINGNHRLRALEKLGREKAEVIVWDVDDEQTDILIATLNRLKGADEVAKKIALLKHLSKKTDPKELGKLLPQTPGQIKRLTELKMPKAPARIKATELQEPLFFFVSKNQQSQIQKALALAHPNDKSKTRAQKNARALAQIAGHFLKTSKTGT
ncbi:MAG: ParB/RepB/Spo0J family partition protein [Planctomycetota bacterium]|jgi:ParB-like chromosome segregation protein Spo0J